MCLGVRWFCCVIFSLWFFVITTRPGCPSCEGPADRLPAPRLSGREVGTALPLDRTVRVVRGDRDTASGEKIFKFIYSYLVKGDCFAINK